MPTTRSYDDACALARALDVVGERWALLVVRELIFSPKRFSDLRRALPKASPNLLADRLRELRGRGVVSHRRLPPPAASSVYELTDWGRGLEPVIHALGDWAAEVPVTPEMRLNPTSVMLYLRGLLEPDPEAPPSTCRIELDGEPWTVRSAAGRLSVEAGETGAADVLLRTDPRTLNDLLEEPRTLKAAISGSAVTVEGNVAALRALLASPRLG